jgi:hypothetical protein
MGKLQKIKSIVGTKLDDSDFFNQLNEQNKSKNWELNPIKIGFANGKVIHNADEISIAVDGLISFIEEKIESADSVEDLEAMRKQTSIIHKWLNGTRIQATAPFDELKSEFTKREKALNSIDFKTKIDELNEEIYKTRRYSMIRAFEALIAETDLHITVDMFESFIELKKKIKTFDLNTKEELSSSAKKAIIEEFEKISKPLIEAKKVKEDTEREHNLFATQMSSIDELDYTNQLKKLNELLLMVDTSYTHIADSAKASITSKIAVINTKIKVSENEAKQSLEADLDEPIINGIRNINIEISTLEFLEDTIPLVKADIDRLKSDTLKIEANYKLQAMNDKLSEIKENIVLQQQKQQEETEPTQRETVLDGKYRLSADDVEFMSSFAVEANSEDEAKNKMLEMIKIHFDMIELKRG